MRLIVKFHFYYFLTVALVAFALYYTPKKAEKPQAHHMPPITHTRSLQEKASHMISIGDSAICSVTAIGPHAILTAEHCNAGMKESTLTVDLSMEVHNILSVAFDDHDHVIYLLDGSPFTYVEEVKAASEATQGDHIIIYGDGHGEFPPVAKNGVVVECNDQSDIDMSAKQVCETLNVIEGDSGAAVYNDKGEIVGLLSYMIENAEPIKAISYGLDFEQDKYDFARNFSGEVKDKPKK